MCHAGNKYEVLSDLNGKDEEGECDKEGGRNVAQILFPKWH
jgi:hypothetical protein